ncbi:MAG TPA: glutathione binding-like protein [Coxiellaceae bacterium]|nr:glutathione binding-like protein [Coxiellaceae bacterium]
MKLYYGKGKCSLAVRILIHELKLPCEFIAIDSAAGKTEDGTDFASINPKLAVPTLGLDDGTVLSENAIIQQYLVDTHHANHLLPPAPELRRYQILSWLNFIATDVHKGFSPLFNKELPDNIKQEIFLPALAEKMAYIDETLAKHSHIFSDELTLPDFYLFTVLRWSPFVGLDLSPYSHVQRYMEMMKNYPAVKQSLEEEGL